MIVFLGRSAVLLHLLAVELWALGRAGGWTPDASAIVVAFCVLDVAPARVPYVLLPLAVGRALLHPGGIAFHLWVLLAVWTLALPVERLVFRERWQLRMVAGAGIAVLLSWLQGLVLTGQAGDPLGRSPAGWVLTGVVTPVGLAGLGAVYRSVARPRPRAAVAGAVE